MRTDREVVAVVVVTFNSEQVLPDLLTSLPAGMADTPWHLTIVDNASSDGTVEVAKNLAPDALIVQTGRNAGYAAGINAGVAEAPEHTSLLVLNADVRLQQGCVPALLEAVRTPGTGMAVPRLVDANGVRIDNLRREPAIRRTLADALIGGRRAGQIGDLGEVISDERCYTDERVTDWAEGSTILISRECWQTCGSWDESFFLYSEETEYFLRARDTGFAARYIPRAHAVHLEGGSNASPPLWALLSMNRVRLYRRRHGAVLGACFWAAMTLREASRALLGKATSKAATRALMSRRLMAAERGPELLRNLG